ncbi:MAG: hypothetical protein KA712_21105 [Myxococcales bacterium]|nr:hypothetical protein [Myxococcales bacterium]
MSSSPSGPADASAPLAPAARTASPGGDPRASAASAEVAFFEAEAEAATDKSRAALCFWEAGHILESELRREKSAVRAYTKALTADPTFQPSAWALRRPLTVRGLHDNLLRVIEAEARFARDVRKEDRADLMLERGRLLARVGRGDEAAAAYRGALALHPGHRAATLSLLGHALATGDAREADDCWRALLALAPQAAVRAAIGSAIAGFWLVSPSSGASLAERGRQAWEALWAAWGPEVSHEELLVVWADRLCGLSGDEASRVALGERLASFAARGEVPPRTQTLRLLSLRETAHRLAARGALDEAAAALDAALLLEPEHPVTAADRLDLASKAGRSDVFDAWPAEDPIVQAELGFRRAEVALRQSAWGEAMAALGLVAPELGLEDLVFVERMRALAGMQDAQGMAVACEAHADALLKAAEAARERKAFVEVAHQYTRAGVLWETELADGARAERLYGQSLSLVPGYRPALEGLASVYTRDGRWDDLAALVAADGAAATTPARALALRETLVLLNRDLLFDLPAALAVQRTLAAPRADDARAAFRWLDLAAPLAAQDPQAQDDALAALERLASRSPAPAVRAALGIMSARLAQGGGRDDDVDPFLERAFAADPCSLAASFLERRAHRTAVQQQSALEAEAEAWAKRPDGEARARALRFRQAFGALERGQPFDALAALEPLAVAQDAAARVWLVDVARRSRDPQLIARTLDSLAREGPPAEGDLELRVLLGELFEGLGRRGDAARVYADVLARAQAFVEGADGGASALRLAASAAFGLLRASAATSDLSSLGTALVKLASLCTSPLAAWLSAESDYVRLVAGEQVAAAPGQEPVLAFLAAARAADASAMPACLRTLAAVSPPGAGRARLWLHLGLAARLSGQEGEALLLAAYEEHASGDLEVALLELPEAKLDASRAAVLGSARLRRLCARSAAGDEASGDLGVLAALDRAHRAETEGSLDIAAASFALALELRPESLEALDGLRRLAQRAGARRDEAGLLERLGEAFVGGAAAATYFAEAALLLEADGEDEHAIRLFYKVLARAPDDDEAFARLRRLLAKTGAWPRLEGLLGFKLTRLGQQGHQCVPLWQERARVRAEGLDDERGALADWQRVEAMDPRDFQAAFHLGRAARKRGALGPARARLETAMATGSPEPGARLACAVELAELCEAMGDRAGVLSALAALDSEHAHVSLPLVQRAEPLCVRYGRAELAVAAYETLGNRGQGAERAAMFVRAGQLLRDGGAPGRAVAAFVEAVKADPLSDAARDLLSAGGVPASEGEAHAALASARDQVLAALCAPPPAGAGAPLFDEPRLQLLAAYGRLLDEPWRVAVAEQILLVMGQGAARGRARSVVGSLDVAHLFALGAETEGASPSVAALAAVWPSLDPFVSRAYAARDPAQAPGRASRIDHRADPRLDWLEAAANTLGLTALVVHQGGSDTQVALPGGALPTLVLGSGLVGGDPASRFRVARALALLRLGVPFAASEPASDVDAQALWVEATIATVAPTRALAAARETMPGAYLARNLPRKVLRTVAPLDEALAQVGPADVRSWLSQVHRAADRFALVVAGDAAEAAFALAGSRSPERVRAHPEVGALLRFALSDAHHGLRVRLGLGKETHVSP